MKLKPNREFVVRHLGVALLMLGLGGYFGFDGLVGYPSQDAAELYRAIEGRAADTQMTREQLEAFKRQKIEAQYGFAILCLLVAGLIGLHLWSVTRLDLEFDETGFIFRGVRHEFKDVKTIDRSKWEKKDIIVVDGIRLDAWHHMGVKELVKKIDHA